MSKAPVLFDLDDNDATTAPDVAAAPPVPDPLPQRAERGSPAAMEQAARLATKAPSRLSRWFWGLVLALISTVAALAAWDFAVALIQRIPLLGWAVSAGLAAAVLLGLVLALREVVAVARLKRVDALRQTGLAASQDVAAARAYVARLDQFYGGRDDLAWGRARLAEQGAEVLDGDALIALAEEALLSPLDQRALQEVEAAARQVATVTALVPMALADVAVALLASLRMIRNVAQIYGGRSGFFSSWRLMRAVLAHLAATGAVAAGDDLLESVLGGSVLSKLSRRFGEGLVNGALSARVGIAAMEVCRPMPFSARHRPSTRKVIKGALKGLFRKEETQP